MELDNKQKEINQRKEDKREELLREEK